MIIYTLLFDEFLMITDFHNPAVFHYHDPAGIMDGGKTVGND